MTDKKIAILGAGSWGTALAISLADRFKPVIWGKREKVVDEINNQRTNKRYLPNIDHLNKSIFATTHLKEAIEGAELIVMAIPTKAIRKISKQLNDVLTDAKLIVNVSKGIEPETNLRMSEVIGAEMKADKLKGIVVLTGPSHAEEVALGQPTTLCASSICHDFAKHVQNVFTNHYLRVYTNEDVIGAEIGGALKNIIALGAGISDGLGYGDNAKAALITRGMAEIVRLGVAAGACAQTFYGLTGMGDLIVTCTSTHSRNWRAGNMLGKGKSLEEILEKMGMVVEGVRTAQAVHKWKESLQIDMPISTVIYKILFENENPQNAVDHLMRRKKKEEKENI